MRIHRLLAMMLQGMYVSAMLTREPHEIDYCDYSVPDAARSGGARLQHYLPPLYSRTAPECRHPPPLSMPYPVRTPRPPNAVKDLLEQHAPSGKARQRLAKPCTSGGRNHVAPLSYGLTNPESLGRFFEIV